MYEARKHLKSQASYDWTWNLLPLLIVAAVMSALFLPQGGAAADTAAAQAAAAVEVSAAAPAIVPSPQPGEGEPECVPAEMAQSY